MALLRLCKIKVTVKLSIFHSEMVRGVIFYRKMV